MIKTGTFYKARDMRIENHKIQGGYLYVYLVGTAADIVTFGIVPEPKTELLTGGTFAVSTADFLKLAGDEVTY